MTREDLKNYKYNQIWIKNQTEYIEAQKETINQLNAILSDMPSGSKKTYDIEAEKLAKLEDCFDELMEDIIIEQKKQKKIVEIIKTIDQPFRNILFEVYIQGKSLVKIASDENKSYEDICRKHVVGLKKFEEKAKSQ